MKKNINKLNEEENIIDMMQIDNIEIENTDTEKYKLQCMLPDYVFRKLSAEDKIFFEKEIKNYPDLDSEVKDAQILFEHIEKFDYKKMMYDKSQYLPDKVVANLEKRNKLYIVWKPTWKRVASVGILAATILIYFYFANKDATQIAESLQQHDVPEIFTDTEKDIIVADMQEMELEDIDYTISDLQSILYDIEETDMYEDIDDYYISEMNTAFTETIQAGGTISEDDYMYLIESFENIDETDFQEILNQIENLQSN